MKRPLIAPLMALALALTPGVAHAGGDSLLSGYGGPGGGEQAVLGAKLLPPKSGGGGLRATAAPSAGAPRLTQAPGAGQTASPPAVATTGAASPSSPASNPRPAAPARQRAGDGQAPAATETRRRSSDRDGAAAPAAGTAPAAGVPNSLPGGVAGPSRASDDGGTGLPLSSRDLALLGLAATILPLAALAMRRLAGREGFDAVA